MSSSNSTSSYFLGFLKKALPLSYRGLPMTDRVPSILDESPVRKKSDVYVKASEYGSS